MGDAMLPLCIWDPVERITRPIVELGLRMIQVLEMKGGLGAILQIVLVFTNINQVVFQLVNAIGIRYERIVFVCGNLTLRNIQHPLPSLNNLPLLNHAGDIGVTGVNHFPS